MEELLKKLPAQFADPLEIGGKENWRRPERLVLCGMGGSALAASLCQAAGVKWLSLVHRDYGLPALSPEEWQKNLLVLSSYSGNTEEVLDAARVAAANPALNVAVIAAGGRLLELAQEACWPRVVLPEGWPPRLALGWSLRALALLAGDETLFVDLAKIKGDQTQASTQAAALAESLAGKIPLIYSSNRNRPLAYHWKIEFNETAKLPAFANVLPEANHNELAGFDPRSAAADFARRLHFIFLLDENDHPRVRRRFQVLANLFRQRYFDLTEINLGTGGPACAGRRWPQLLQNFLTSVWTSYYLARRAGLDPASVPLIEEFKKLIG